MRHKLAVKNLAQTLPTVDMHTVTFSSLLFSFNMPIEHRSSSTNPPSLPTAITSSSNPSYHPRSLHRSNHRTILHSEQEEAVYENEEDDDDDDEDEESDDDDEETVNSITSSTRRTSGNLVSPSRSSKGLPQHVQKQLLQDIEQFGGIGVCPPGSSFTRLPFKLQHLCKRRCDIYGRPGTDLRKQVENRVQKLKKLKQADYYRLLAELGVQPQGRRQEQEEAEPLLTPPPLARHRQPALLKKTGPGDQQHHQTTPAQKPTKERQPVSIGSSSMSKKMKGFSLANGGKYLHLACLLIVRCCSSSLS